MIVRCSRQTSGFIFWLIDAIIFTNKFIGLYSNKRRRNKKVEAKIPYTPDQSQLIIIQRKLYLDNRIRNGVNWFFFIAGFSLLNTVIYFFGGTITFVIGLGATQIVDGFMYTLAKDLGQTGILFRAIGFIIDVCIAGVFIIFGVFGRKRIRWPIIVGMVLYIIDGIVLLLFQDFLGAGFHLFALFGIWTGLKSLSELEVLEKTGTSESIESIRQRMPSLRPQITPQQRRSRWILVGLIALVFVALFVYASLQH